jgi:molecular chaperone GrpE
MMHRDGENGPGAEARAGRKPNGHAAGGGGASEAPEASGPAEGLAVDADVIADLEATLENTQAELSRTNDRLLRLAAEFDNYRKRTDRDRAELWGRAQADLVSRLLDALDDLGRVADHDENTPAAALLEGVQLVERKLRTAFQSAGLETIDPAGETFDPSTMEAVAIVEAEHPEEDDVVSDVFQVGYRYKSQLIRPARVRVKKYEA